jgi:phenylpropionate dioxygenase-like ring-hydroxylating dioxygenase large terminal subunit
MLMKNHWYVLAREAEVGLKPLRVRALDQHYVLYRRRSDGRVVALSDVCVHRNGSLAGGSVTDDCITCPYHGWTYQSDGACTSLPANPAGTPVSRRARVDSYPVVERFGWVWVFLGDLPEDQRPPLPELPEFGQPGWRAVYGSFTWNAGYTRVVENTIDVAHTPFVHRNSFGNAENPTMPDYAVVTRASGVEATVTLESPTPRGLSRLLLGPDARNTVGLVIDLVSFNRLTTTMSNGWALSILFAHTPVDEKTTLTRFIQVRNFLPYRFADGIARRFSLQIIREDQAIVEAQTPQQVPTRRDADLSLRSDALSLAYRALLARSERRGDRIDTRAVRQAREDEGRVLVIPSPDRRRPELSSAWVHAEVPSLTPDAGDSQPAGIEKKAATG